MVLPVGKRILLIVAGGIAAYKCLDLVRRLRERGYGVRTILTAAAAEFVTPLSFAALSGEKVYQELFSLTDESEMGHIRLSREADLVVVAPATAHLLARMALGLADDLATTALLATDKPIIVAPAMNVRMWDHPATQQNVATLGARGVTVVGPAEGEMACGEWGYGRMAEVEDVLTAIDLRLTGPEGIGARLKGRRCLVTSGPTREPIDPVRFLSNRSSGKQGHAIAAALRHAGAATTLVTGPTTLTDPEGVATVHIESAAEMLAACRAALPVDAAVCAAAVSDWTAAHVANAKIKKVAGAPPPTLALAETPDILATLAGLDAGRPRLVIGFAAETENVVANAIEKRARKGCDWIVANDVSPRAATFGGDDNTVHLISADGVEDWPRLSKTEVAARLAVRIADWLDQHP